VIKIIFKDIVDRYVNYQCCAAVMSVGDVMLLRSVGSRIPASRVCFSFAFPRVYELSGRGGVLLFRSFLIIVPCASASWALT